MKDINIEMFGVQPSEETFINYLFQNAGFLPKVTYHQEPIPTEDSLPDSDANVLCVFIDSNVSADVMKSFPNLSLIVTRSTGYDHIDMKETKKRNIAVSNVPSYGENTVAEFAFGLILCLSRKIHLASCKSSWPESHDSALIRGFDLFGKTIGVIGTGRIGRQVITIAKGFGMNVVAYDPKQSKELESQLGFKYASIDELLTTSDVVTIHVPYTKETHHLMDETAFSKMKQTAIIINTSRGGIIDTNALVTALKEKKIAGAGLDVLEEEDVIKDESAFLTSNNNEKHSLRTILADHALMTMPNVLVTPHNAYNSIEALERILATTVQNIMAWHAKKPINIVE
jgi:D-lactate dehydrogenase